MALQELYIFLHYVGFSQIVVRGDEPHVFPAAERDSFIVVPQMPEVWVVADVANAWIGKSGGHFRRVIRREIVHDQHLNIRVGLREDRIETFRQKVSKIVARDNKADSWRFHGAYIVRFNLRLDSERYQKDV